MTSLTVENYLKAIQQIASNTGQPSVSTGQLSGALGVSPGTVTSMLKTLAESGLANYRPYEGATLTESGRTLAMRMIRRHRLIELFLVRTLDLTWDQVHEEAEHMEHAVSDFLVDRIDAYLGQPHSDPHGDPIPSAEGELRGDHWNSIALAGAPLGRPFRIVRITNQEPEFLRFLTESGLTLGREVLVEQNNLQAGVLTVRVDAGTLAVGLQAAQQILVQAVG